MKLAPQQRQAIDAIKAWRRNSASQVFRLFGYAGTGKTTLAKYIAEDCRLPLFCAFTGKAAYVLRQKGCEAYTIHQLIYNPQERSKQRLQCLEVMLASCEDPDEALEIQKKIDQEHKKLNSPKFKLNPESPIKDADLVIVDEVSMVNEQMAKDLMSFGTDILVLGDPAQLPPVFGTGYFIDAKPDFMLTEIHRQARENPIIQLATEIRNRRMPKPDGNMVIPWGSISSEEVLTHDQILVGKNTTKKATNFRMRDVLKRNDELPVPGDRVVCLRNDHDIGLLNGSIWTVDTCMDVDGGSMIDLIVRNDEGSCVAVEAHKHHFISMDDKPLPIWIRKEAQEFDYGYALTCHKAQGSQWDSVLVFDESSVFGRDKYKWLYTAVTRAAEKLTLVVR